MRIPEPFRLILISLFVMGSLIMLRSLQNEGVNRYTIPLEESDETVAEAPIPDTAPTGWPEVVGKIMYTAEVEERRGKLRQKLTYYFEAGDSVYLLDQYTILANDPYPAGCRLRIAYDPDNPRRSKIKSFFRDFDEERWIKFNAPKKDGYKELYFVNDIVTYTDFGKGGTLLQEWTGILTWDADTVVLQPIDPNPYLPALRLQWAIDSTNDKELFTDLSGGEVYYNYHEHWKQ